MVDVTAQVVNAPLFKVPKSLEEIRGLLRGSVANGLLTDISVQIKGAMQQ